MTAPQACVASATHPPKGLAALSIVMVLFFVMALTAAYTNRNLIFEQRVAANSYRAEQAIEVADGGIDWALQMLNSGRIGTDCRPSADTSQTAPRRRYLNRNGTGGYTAVKGDADETLFPSCVLRNAQLTCVCPTSSTPNPTPHAVKDWALNAGGSAFRVSLLSTGGGPRPGVAVVAVRGCGTPGTGSTSCVADVDRPEVDGIADVRQLIGLVRALPHPPIATLTAAGQVQASTAVLRVVNADSATGLSARAGGALSADSASQFAGPAGSAQPSQQENDSTLTALAPATADLFTANDRLFRSVFGMEAPTFSRQPAVVFTRCGNAGCSAADLRNAMDRYPGLILWYDGDLDLASVPSAASLGTSDEPALVIVTGELRVAAALDLRGFFYAREVTWTGAASGARLTGALMSATDVVADATMSLVYDADLLRTIQLYYGSFVRAPGGWTRAGS